MSRSPTSFLAVLPLPFLSESISVTEELHKKGKNEAPDSLLSLCLVPGYSKLQIAADNIDRYWSMFDLLTHTLSSSSSSYL